MRSFKVDIGSPFGMFAISPDSRFFARRLYKYKNSRGQSWIQIVDLASGKELSDLVIPGNSLVHSTSPIAFSTNSRWLAVQSDFDNSMTTSIYLFDVLSGRVVREIKSSTFLSPSISADVNRIQINPFVFSPDNKILALGGGGSIQLWDPDSGAELHSLRTNFKSTALSSSDKGQEYAAVAEQAFDMLDELAEEDSPMDRVYDLASGKLHPMMQNMMPVRSMADKRIQFSPGLRWIVTSDIKMFNSGISNAEHLIPALHGNPQSLLAVLKTCLHRWSLIQSVRWKLQHLAFAIVSLLVSFIN